MARSKTVKQVHRDPEEIRMCDCAQCGAILCGESERAWLGSIAASQAAAFPPCVAGRIFGRPYCANCLRCRKRDPRAARPAVAEDSAGPWADNAIRALEGE